MMKSAAVMAVTLAATFGGAAVCRRRYRRSGAAGAPPVPPRPPVPVRRGAADGQGVAEDQDGTERDSESHRWEDRSESSRGWS